MNVPAATVARLPRHALPLQLAAFGLLCWAGAVQWSRFVSGPPEGRVLAVVALATAGALSLGILARAPIGRRTRAAASIAVVLAVAAGSALAAGLPIRYLAPAHWSALGDGIDRGLAGSSSTGWPYVGSDPWVRLTLLLGIPALAVPAMALGFWPAPRRAAAAAGSLLALVLLLALFAVPATERTVGAPLVRGAALLGLIGTWLWLPRLRGRRLAAGLAAIAAATVLALPVAGALQHHAAWVDYTTWDLFASRGAGHSFDWTHRYGPLDWPRRGTTMLLVRSPHPHYWKAETLDRFDGLRWVHSGAGSSSDPSAELPMHRNTRWDERIHFTISGLQSNFLIGAGTVYSVDGTQTVLGTADGTIRVLDGPLSKGADYSVMSYVPDPSAAQMRSAPHRFQTQFLSYTYFDLPRRSDSALREPPPPDGASNVTPRTVGAPVPGAEPGADPRVLRLILASPYAREYRLARRLAAGQPTAYDVVKNVERYLERGFTYDEHPALRALPLDAFLFRDRIGYCQQFSGAMALLLRMDGIPARVAAGFAPGIPDPNTKEYRVRDLDAHSWVEVWFDGIGWVPFDPTPSLSPASAQASGDRLPSAAVGGHESAKDTGAGHKARPADVAGGAGRPSGTRPWLVLLAVLGIPLAGIASLWLAAIARARRVRRAGQDPELQELSYALERLGYPIPPGTTLLELERRLGVTAGPGAARYARALRQRRFASRARALPVRLDRRALRRGLGEGRGPIVKLRALLVLPPRRAGQPSGGGS